MNEKIAGIIKDVIQIIIHYIPIGILEVLLVRFMYDAHIPFFGAFALVLMPLAFYAVRVLIHRPLSYLAAHFIIAAAVWMLPGMRMGQQVFHGAAAVVYLCASIALCMKKDDFREKQMVYDIPAAVLVSMIAVEYFVSAYQKQTDLLPEMATATVLLVLGYYTVHYTTNYLKFFRSNRAAARNMPKGKMLKEGGMMTVVFTLTSTLVLYFCAKASFVDDWFGKILLTFRKFVSYLLSLIPAHEAVEEIAQKLPKELPAPVLPETAEEAAEAGMMAQVMDQATKFFAVTVIVCFVMGLIISVAAAYLRSFDKNQSQDEVKEKIRKEKTEKTGEEKQEEKKSFFAIFSAGERIRQIFAKTIRQRLSGEKQLQTAYPVDAMTARELHVLFPEEKRENYAALAELYERARYSPEECKNEDVQRAKRLAQTLR